MAPRQGKSQKPSAKMTKQQRLNTKEIQAALAESRVRYDGALNQLKNANYQKALEGFVKMAAGGAASESLTHRARSILFTSHDADYLQNFIRVGDGGEDGARPEASSGPAHKNRPSITLTLPLKLPGAETSDVPTTRRGTQRSSGRQESAPASAPQPRRNTPFAQMSKDIRMRRIQQQQQELQTLLRQGRRSGKGDSYFRRGEECYTDKDRAAAVNMGTRDIKLSLKLKRRHERSKALQIPEQAEPSTLLALGGHEMKGGDLRVALGFVNKALELQPNDKYALVARSKCHLLLGLAKEALQDADGALAQDSHFIKGIFQKAEALYHLGDFEHSLMFYHRGQRLRPEQAGFRLGVQKAQEAIENAIDNCKDKLALLYMKGPSEGSITVYEKDDSENINVAPIQVAQKRDVSSGKSASASSRKSASSSTKTEAKQPKQRHLLGQLNVDRQYLENLLQHPDIKTTPNQPSVEHISSHVEEGVAFLKRRQEFWRQQCPNAKSPSKK